MAVFKKFNDKTGVDYVCHTATGYRCESRVVIPEDIGKKIYFWAKHVVGKDGRPYTEIGFESREVFNKRELMNYAKSELSKAGFREVHAITSEISENEVIFAEHATPYPNMIEIRVRAGTDGVVKVFHSMSSFISREAIQFVEEQESDLENILYQSIMSEMGEELRRGPGGESRACEKARQLTDMFIHGLQLN